ARRPLDGARRGMDHWTVLSPDGRVLAVEEGQRRSKRGKDYVRGRSGCVEPAHRPGGEFTPHFGRGPLAVCGVETCRRAILRGFRAGVRSGNRHIALLQRVWTEAGSEFAIRSGYPPFCIRAGRGEGAHHLWRWGTDP